MAGQYLRHTNFSSKELGFRSGLAKPKAPGIPFTGNSTFWAPIDLSVLNESLLCVGG